MALKPEQAKLANEIIRKDFGKIRMKTLMDNLASKGIKISEPSVRLRAAKMNLKGAYNQDPGPRIIQIANRTIHRLV
jgi:hypothetical protein